VITIKPMDTISANVFSPGQTNLCFLWRFTL